MFKSLRKKIIVILGGINIDDHDTKIKNLKYELDAYKNFAKSIYNYAGNYPAWKAQSELREYMSEIGKPISREKPDYLYLDKIDHLDLYFGRVVDGFIDLSNVKPYFMDYNSEFWNEKISEARGDRFLRTENES